MVDLILCIFANLFRLYLVRRYINLFLGKSRYTRLQEVVAYVSFCIINTWLYMSFHLVVINVLNNLIGISLLAFMNTKSVKANLFVTGSVYIIQMICDTVATILFVDYTDGQGFNQIYSVIAAFLMFICELLIERIVISREHVEDIHNLPLIFVPLSSVAMICLLVYTGNYTSIGIVIVSIGVMVTNFLVFYLYNMLTDAFSQKYENEVLKQKVQIYANQIDVILQTESQLKTMKHDMKHHLNELKILAMKNNVAEIQGYIDDMEDYIQNPNELVASGNTDIDSVLNYMLEKARKLLRTVEVKICLPEEIRHSFDINIILGNLLENAIEAAKCTEEKYLLVNILLKQGVLRIEIKNSFSGVQSLRVSDTDGKKHFLSTKEDAVAHGIGLGSVRNIVEKYNGLMEVMPENTYFGVKLILYMS